MAELKINLMKNCNAHFPQKLQSIFIQNIKVQEIYQAMLWFSKAKLKPTKGQNRNM